MINRREFLLSTGGLAAAGVTINAESPAPTSPPEQTRPKTAKRALMKVGCQSPPATEAHFKYQARYGVKNVAAWMRTAEGAKNSDRTYNTVEELKTLRDLAAKWGVSVDIVQPPAFLEITHVDKEKHAAIMLGESPERDRDIESFQTMIKNCAAAGIPCVKYNMSWLGMVRTGRTPGRGDASYNTWRLAEAHPDTPMTRAGRMTADLCWERITYFLDRVVPVAAEYKVRIACHPHDPGMPPDGYQGIDTVLGTVDGLKKFVSIRENTYHGLNFCQGTISEMLADPGKEIFDVIRYFGTRKKIFNVHFRNIRGHRNDFMEVYPDEGSVDFVKAIQVYKEVDYDGMLMPDHVPIAPGDTDSLQSFAFCYGYIRALIQAADQMA